MVRSQTSLQVFDQFYLILPPLLWINLSFVTWTWVCKHFPLVVIHIKWPKLNSITLGTHRKEQLRWGLLVLSACRFPHRQGDSLGRLRKVVKGGRTGGQSTDTGDDTQHCTSLQSWDRQKPWQVNLNTALCWLCRSIPSSRKSIIMCDPSSNGLCQSHVP